MEALRQPGALRNTPLELPYVPAGQAAHTEDLEAPAARENCTDAVTRTVAERIVSSDQTARSKLDRAAGSCTWVPVLLVP